MSRAEGRGAGRGGGRGALRWVGQAGRRTPRTNRTTPTVWTPPAPSSCLVTEWGEWDACSATCGMGMKKRHRMVKMSPADGSMCKAETSQAEKCMMPECREWVWGGLRAANLKRTRDTQVLPD